MRTESDIYVRSLINCIMTLTVQVVIMGFMLQRSFLLAGAAGGRGGTQDHGYGLGESCIFEFQNFDEDDRRKLDFSIFDLVTLL